MQNPPFLRRRLSVRARGRARLRTGLAAVLRLWAALALLLAPGGGAVPPVREGARLVQPALRAGAPRAAVAAAALAPLAALVTSQGVAAAAGTESTVSWGANHFGKLGDGTTTPHTTPASVHGPGDVGSLGGTGAIAGGGDHSLAADADGKAWAWGYNVAGQLGDGTTTQRTSPVQVGGLTDVSVTAVGAGNYHSLALTGAKTVRAWGYNAVGQLGDGTTTGSSTPVAVQRLTGGPLTGVTAITVGGDHNLALGQDQTVRAWGSNGLGEGGTGAISTRLTTAQQVKGPGGTGVLTGVVAVAGGQRHSLALQGDGTVLAWGSQGSGQLGDGIVQFGGARTAPFAVLSGAAAIGAGDAHSLAVKADGGVVAWGRNSKGQLGDGTRPTPPPTATTPTARCRWSSPTAAASTSPRCAASPIAVP